MCYARSVRWSIPGYIYTHTHTPALVIVARGLEEYALSPTTIHHKGALRHVDWVTNWDNWDNCEKLDGVTENVWISLSGTGVYILKRKRFQLVVRAWTKYVTVFGLKKKRKKKKITLCPSTEIPGPKSPTQFVMSNLSCTQLLLPPNCSLTDFQINLLQWIN